MKRIKILMCLLLAACSVWGVPADPSIRRVIVTAQGEEKLCRLVGDEYGSYWQALDNSGCYVEKADERGVFVRVEPASIVSKAKVRRAAARAKDWQDGVSDLGFPCTLQHLKGRKKILVLLVEFQDLTFQSDNAREILNEVFNTRNYKEGRFKGSVKDYFLAQSNDQLELDFDVVGPFKASKNCAYYGKHTDNALNEHMDELVTELVNMANKEVDFSLYTWDDPNTVEEILIIYAGLDEAAGGTTDNIWAHKSSVGVTKDNVYLKFYACASELRSINGQATQNGVGTICHELSHCFGLPDTYDQKTGNYGTNYWDLMGMGVHLDNGYTPSGYTAYDKMYCLWQSPVVLKDDAYIDNIKPMSEGGNFYLIPNDGWKNEFFLLENRQKTGWDGALYGKGMMVMHVDYDKNLFTTNFVNRTEGGNDHERLGLVLADNNPALGSTYSQWVADMQGDLYPCGSNNSLTNTSVPAATLFHKNIDNTKLLSKPVTEITQNNDGTMSFRFVNDLKDYTNYFLTAREDTIRFVSNTEATLKVKLRNASYLDYKSTVGAFVYILQDNEYVLQEPRDIVSINLSADEEEEYLFHLSGLKDDTDYYICLYFHQTQSDDWQQLCDPYTFNMANRHKFVLSEYASAKVTYLSESQVRLDAFLHNESYNTYNRYIGVYTYIIQDGSYVIQQPRSLNTQNFAPYSDMTYSFTLDGLKKDVTYYAFLFYYETSSTTSWSQLSYSYAIQINDDTLPTDIGRIDNGQPTTDSHYTICRLDGKVVWKSGKNVSETDLLQHMHTLPKGLYIIKKADGSSKKVVVN